MKNKIKKILSITFATLLLSACISFDDDFGGDSGGDEIARLNSIETTRLSIKDNTLKIDGEINSKTPQQIKHAFQHNPNIDTLLFADVPGSLDDVANLEIANWLAQKELTTQILNGGHVASGGTDLFLVGDRRIVEAGAQIGVHSWSDGVRDGVEYARSDTAHRPYINYYINVGFSPAQAEDFYFFTLGAASAENVHYMTRDEILRYGIATDFIE